MLQPLVQTAERLLTVQPPGSVVLEASQRKSLILATFDRMAVVFRCVSQNMPMCPCGPCEEWPRTTAPLCAECHTSCRYVQDPEAIVQSLAKVWWLMDAAMTAYSGDASATERLCRLPRYSLRNSGTASAPLLEPLLATLPARYEASGNSSFLYVASELVKLFGSEPAHDLGISTLPSLFLSQCPSRAPSCV